MESGSVIGNALKTIYSRITTVQGVKDVLKDVGIDIQTIGKNGEKDVKPVNKILGEIAGKWNDLSSAQRQNIAVQVAGRYQLSRFIALMNNWDTAVKATRTAYNSQGSAMRENEKYMNSFEARINKLKTAFTEMSLAIGKAFLSDGMMLTIETLKNLANLAANLADKFGALPFVFSAVSLALLKMGFLDKFKNKIEGVFSSIQNFGQSVRADGIKKTFKDMAVGVDDTKKSVNKLDDAVKTTDGSVKGLKLTFKGLMASTVIGLAFAVVGAGIEKLISHMADLKREQEELDKVNKSMVKSYHDHGNSYDDLIAKYDKLNDKFQKNKEAMSDDELNEYYKVTNELANAMPNVVKYVDANGQAHLRSTKAIKEEAERVRDLSKAEADLTKARQKENVQKRIDDINKVIKKMDGYRDVINKIKGEQKLLREGKMISLNGDIMNISKEAGKSMAKDKNVDIQEQKTQIIRAQSEMQDAIKKTIGTIQDQSRAYLESRGMLTNLGDAQIKVVENFSQQNHALIENASQIKNTEKRNKALKDTINDLIDGSEQIGEVFSDSFQQLSKGIGDNPVKLNQLKRQLNQVAGALPDDFLVINEKAGKSIDDVKQNLQSVLSVTGQIKGGSTDIDAMVKSLEATGMSSDYAKGFVAKLANEFGNQEIRAKVAKEGLNEYTDEVNDLAQAALNAINPIEELFGINSNQIAGMQSHIQTLQIMKNTYKDNYKETDQWKLALSELSQYLGVSEDAIANNLTYYGKLLDALSKVQVKTDDAGNATLDYSNMSKQEAGALQEAIRKMGGTSTIMDILKGKTKGNTDATKENTDATNKNTSSKNRNKQSAQEQAKAIDTLKDRFQTLKGEMNTTNRAAYFDTIKKQLSDLGSSVKVTQDKAGNFKLEMADGSKSQYLDTLQSELKDLGVKIGVVKDDSGKLKLVLNEGTQSTTLLNLGDNAKDAKLKIDDTVKAVKDFNKTDILPKDFSKINFVALSQGIETATGKVQLLSEGLEGTADNIVSAYDQVNKLYSTVKHVKKTTDTIMDNTSSFDVMQKKVDDLVKALFDAQDKMGKLFNNMDFDPNKITAPVTTARKSIGKMSSSAKNARTDIGKLKTSLSKLTFKSGSAKSFTHQLALVCTNLVNVNKYSKTATSQQNKLTSAFNKVVTASKSFNHNVKNAYDKVSSSYHNLAKTLSSSTSKIVGSYNKNKSAVKSMSKDSNKAFGSISSNIKKNSSKSSDAVGSMAKKMRSSFKSQTDKIVSIASGLPKRIGDAIRKHSGEATGSMTSVAKSMVKRFKKELGINSPSKVFTNLGGWVIKGLANGLTGEDLKSLGKSVFEDFGGGVFDTWDMIKAYLSAGDLGKAANGSLKEWLTAAIGATGVSMDWLQPLYTMAMHESGGNPRAINLWDSNARAGHPSQGLMQTIPSTFNAYKIKGFDDILNPIHNAIAAIRYILARYGSVWNTPSIRSMTSGRGYRGYATGGIVDKPELAWHAEEGKEAIIPLIPKRRSRGIELWEQAGRMLGISPALIELLKAQFSRKTAGMAFGGGATAAMASGEGGSESSGGGDSGTSGVIKPSIPTILSYRTLDGDYEFSAQASKPNPYADRPSAFTYNKSERTINGYEAQINAMTAMMEGLNKSTVKYRDTLKSVIALQNKQLSAQKSYLKATENRNKWIDKELKKLPAVNKQTTKQRERYNSLMEEYDSNLSKISSLKTEIEQATVAIKEKSVEIFTDFINEITGKYDDAISKIKAKVDDTEFKIDVMQITNPDDKKSLLNAQIDKANELQQQQATAKNKVDALQSQYNSAAKKYGSGSEQAKAVKEQLDQAKEDLEDYTLAVVQAEKDIKDTRASIADDAIEKLKSYYSNMKQMADEAIDAEKAKLEKAHEAKMKMYEDEENSINAIYQAKLDALDATAAEEDYEATIAEKNKQKADLINKIALLSKDTSLEGKKKLADAQAQLEELNKDISDTQKQHARDQQKKALQDQQEQQLNEINGYYDENGNYVKGKKDKENDDYQAKSDELDEQKKKTDAYYDNIINNERKWADIRNEAINGNFTNINKQLSDMFKNITDMSKGIFTGLYTGGAKISDDTAKTLAQDHQTDIDNMNFESTPTIKQAKDASGAKGYKMTDGKVQTNKGTKVTTPNETTPPPKPKPKPKPSPKPSSGGGSSSSKTTYYTIKKGDTFWDIENKYGLKHGTLEKLNPHVNPNKLKIGQKIILKKGSSSSSGSSKKPSSSSSGADRKTTSALYFRKSPSYGNNIMMTIPKNAKVDYLGMEKGWAKIKYKGKVGYVGSKYLVKLKSGGYTGDYVPKEGAMAILHRKELVLNEKQTADILNVAKITEKIANFIPNITKKLAPNQLAPTPNTITSNIYHENINVVVENGDKKKAVDIANEVMKGLRKRGK